MDIFTVLMIAFVCTLPVNAYFGIVTYKKAKANGEKGAWMLLPIFFLHGVMAFMVFPGVAHIGSQSLTWSTVVASLVYWCAAWIFWYWMRGGVLVKGKQRRGK
jgi:uncharacterized membrane protein